MLAVGVAVSSVEVVEAGVGATGSGVGASTGGLDSERTGGSVAGAVVGAGTGASTGGSVVAEVGPIEESSEARMSVACGDGSGE